MMNGAYKVIINYYKISILLLLMFGIILLEVFYDIEYLKIKDLKVSDYFDILIVFLFVAFMIERTLEMFFGSDDEKKTKAVQDLKLISRQIKDLPELENEVKSTELQNKETDLKTLIKHLKDQKTKMAFAFAIVLGLIISFCGIRVIEQLIVPQYIENMTKNNYELFSFADTMLSATLLAGGSQPIHDIMVRFKEFTRGTTL
jgi:hypothetical protein